MSIRRGFHRIGIVSAAPFLIGAAVLVGIAAYDFVTPPQDGPWNRWKAQADLDRVKANLPKVRLDPSRDVELYMLSEGFPLSEFESKPDEQLVTLRAAAILTTERRRRMLDTQGYAIAAGFAAAGGILLYLISWSIGWVASGFRNG